MTTVRQRVALAATVLALSGCMSLSGLGGESKYACTAPEGVACESVSGTYANALANKLPSQRERRAPAARTSDNAPPGQPVSPPPVGLPAAGAVAGQPGAALRAQARYLRLWIKPWEDIDGDLYDQAHVYVQIDHGRWLIDHIQQRIRDAHAPLRPPAPSPAGADTRPAAALAQPGITPQPAFPLSIPSSSSQPGASEALR